MLFVAPGEAPILSHPIPSQPATRPACILMSTIRAFMMSPSLSRALADFYLPVSLAS